MTNTELEEECGSPKALQYGEDWRDHLISAMTQRIEDLQAQCDALMAKTPAQTVQLPSRQSISPIGGDGLEVLYDDEGEWMSAEDVIAALKAGEICFEVS